MIPIAAGYTGAHLHEFCQEYLRHVQIRQPIQLEPEAIPAARAALSGCIRRASTPGGGELVLADGGRWWRSLQALATNVRGVVADSRWMETLERPVKVVNYLPEQKFRMVLLSYIHMHLNRFGFWGHTEELALRLMADAAVATSL